MRALNGVLTYGLAFCAFATAQQPSTLVMPNAHRPASAAAGPAFDPVFRFGYGNRREAAAAALLAGETAQNIGGNRERALGMFMMAVQRDPSYARALYNLGVMSARGERWDDALKFYQEARRLDPARELGEAIDNEIIRVDVISRIESIPDGKRRRHFDIQLTDIIARLNDPAIALDNAMKLAKSDPSRWEAPAVEGIAQALIGQYDESAKSLDAGSRLAPAEWRPKLTAAADLSRREGQYARLVREADATTEKQQYENAARMYADAWQASPSRIQTGMQAAVSFLMADQISLAVQTLSRLRQAATPEMSEKAGLMLKELAAVSGEAKAALLQAPAGASEPIVDVGERVRQTLGDLRSPEMKIATSPDPPLVTDPLRFIHVNDDQINNPASDLLLVSSQSLFTTYQGRVGASAPLAQYMVPGTQVPYAGSSTPPVPGAMISAPYAQPAATEPPRPRLDSRPEPSLPPGISPVPKPVPNGPPPGAF